MCYCKNSLYKNTVEEFWVLHNSFKIHYSASGTQFKSNFIFHCLPSIIYIKIEITWSLTANCFVMWYVINLAIRNSEQRTTTAIPDHTVLLSEELSSWLGLWYIWLVCFFQIYDICFIALSMSWNAAAV